jgi:hypothetical protein
VGKPEEKGQLRIPSRRWENKIKMDLRKIRYGGLDSIVLVQDRDQCRALVNTVMDLQVP